MPCWIIYGRERHPTDQLTEVMMIQSTACLLLMCSFQRFTQALLFFFSVAVEALGFGEIGGNFLSALPLYGLHLRGLIKWMIRNGSWSEGWSDGKFTFGSTVLIRMKSPQCKAVSHLIYFLVHFRVLQTANEVKHTMWDTHSLLLGAYTPILFTADYSDIFFSMAFFFFPPRLKHSIYTCRLTHWTTVHQQLGVSHLIQVSYAP